MHKIIFGFKTIIEITFLEGDMEKVRNCCGSVEKVSEICLAFFKPWFFRVNAMPNHFRISATNAFLTHRQMEEAAIISGIRSENTRVSAFMSCNLMALGGGSWTWFFLDHVGTLILTTKSFITENIIMFTKESSQGPSTISPEIPANAFMDTETSVFSCPFNEIAAF